MNIMTTAKNSPVGKLNVADLKKIGMNLLVFGAPTLSVFFGQLAMGVDWKVAAPVAALVFYSAIADFFKKLKNV